MDQHTLELLEFPAVLAGVGESCFSPQGRRLLERQEILNDPAALKERLDQAVAFRRILDAGASFPAMDCAELAGILRGLQKAGAVFDPEELALLGRFLLSAARLKRFLLGAGEPVLAEIAAGLPENAPLTREIFTLVDRDGTVRDSSVPVLRDIRARIRRLQREVERLAQGYLARPEYRSYWQSDVPSQRGGRTVLPLRANFKGRIGGIVHDASASGATLYLEPTDVVERNNEIAAQESLFQRELHRLLRELSRSVGAQAAQIRSTMDAVAHLDTLYARAVYARQHDSRPALPAAEGLNLREARHPLLGPQAVPITAGLGRGCRALIITGPNTGGKTVTLKTVGLLATMNQFGMEIPAAEGSSLALYDEILADIGDEQSIEQSLSTFSGHIRNIGAILERATARSLVLLDELGAGTDPQEGVALAMAILDRLGEVGALCLATTHHGILKNYGYSREGAENASMEFDAQSLRPTYRMITGVPGESHALEIARRTGLPREVADAAERYLEEERGDISQLIRSLSYKQRELLSQEQSQASRETELRDKIRDVDLKELRLRQRELELQEHGLGELRRLLRESRSRLEQLLAQLDTGEKRPAGREVRSFLLELEEETRRRSEQAEELRRELGARRGFSFRAGMEVLIRGTGRRGRILRRGKGDRWVVATETLRGSFPSADLEPAEPAGERQEVSVVEELSRRAPSFELDLRGLRLEEALQRLEQQIDRALAEGLSRFGVIHGLGEGILKDGVRRYLGERREVTGFQFAPPEEGGFGKTIVQL